MQPDKGFLGCEGENVVVQFWKTQATKKESWGVLEEHKGVTYEHKRDEIIRVLSKFWVTVDQACNERQSEAGSQCSCDIKSEWRCSLIIRAHVDIAGIAGEYLGVNSRVSEGNEFLCNHIFLI